jgi:hypothetical protein
VTRTAPLTAPEVEAEMERLGGQLEEATEQYAMEVVAAANAEVVYKIEYAKSYLRSKGTVAERESTAQVRCEAQLRSYKNAEAVMKAAKERLVTLRAHIDWLRTVAANVRAQH